MVKKANIVRARYLVCPTCGHREDAPDYLRAAFVLTEPNKEGRYQNAKLRTRHEIGNRLGVHGQRLNIMLIALVQSNLAVKPWDDQDLFRSTIHTGRSIRHYEKKGWSFAAAHAAEMKKKKAWYAGRPQGGTFDKAIHRPKNFKDPARVAAGRKGGKIKAANAKKKKK